MLVLIFDTETTGLLPKGAAEFPQDYPHIVQLSFIFFNSETGKHEPHDFILKGSFSIPEEATAVHGITKSRSDACGFDFKDVYGIFKVYLDQAEFIVAHNIDFDLTMLRAECARNALEFPPLPAKYCTMKKNTDRCAIYRDDKPYPKFPTLLELYHHFFQESPDNLHDSMTDSYACLRCFCVAVLKKDAPAHIVKKLKHID